MEEIAPVWYILTGDHIRLDDKEVEVLPQLQGEGLGRALLAILPLE